ncbi:nicotinamide riboside transporter PnuC [Flagellimonas oceanensis]|uniref:nicotinamide riboside transporter PnuC n=1 Tax=Flagellimonas oceanensis TaxID=2499163 RepID=UPI001F1D49B9|nr:nicotinamide riboside transporter PnuC [Allomuricauda oceanensis]
MPFLGFIFFVIQAYLARQGNYINYLFGICSILIHMWLFWESRLYGEILMTLVFLCVIIYGWISWVKRKGQWASSITYSTCHEHRVSNLIVMCCLCFFSYVLRQHTNSVEPYWYAMVCAFAFTGMWLMAKNNIESWIYLNIGGLMAVPLFVYRGLYIFAGLTAVFLAIGISAYVRWKKRMNNSGEDKLVKT